MFCVPCVKKELTVVRVGTDWYLNAQHYTRTQTCFFLVFVLVSRCTFKYKDVWTSDTGMEAHARSWGIGKRKGAVQTYLRDLLVGYVPAIGATMDFCVWVWLVKCYVSMCMKWRKNEKEDDSKECTCRCRCSACKETTTTKSQAQGRAAQKIIKEPIAGIHDAQVNQSVKNAELWSRPILGKCEATKARKGWSVLLGTELQQAVL